MRYIVQIIPAIILIIIGKYYVSDELRPEFLGSGLIFFITFFFVEVVYDVYQNYGKLKKRGGILSKRTSITRMKKFP